MKPTKLALVALVLALGATLALADEEVTVKRDLAYYDGKDRDEKKQALDLYIPAGEGPFPVLLFIHGGSWKMGDRRIYPYVGKTFAKQKILTAVMSYRLSPDVKHPEQVRDVARAIAWLKKNAKENKGDPDKLFVSGQSAGGHLTALVSLNDKYLKEVGLDLTAIKAAIPISGVYWIGPTFPDVFPAETREDAEPAKHIVKDAPPFFVIWADKDIPNLRLLSPVFAKDLEKKGNRVKTLEVKDRNHISIVAKIGSEGDELTDAVVRYVLDESKAEGKKDEAKKEEGKKDAPKVFR